MCVWSHGSGAVFIIVSIGLLLSVLAEMFWVGAAVCQSLKKVSEIIGYMYITSVPQTPEYVKGVINLRGQRLRGVG